jgi:hypothetical protein
MTHVVLLDNEAVQALGEPGHAKHRRVLSHLQVVADRRRRALQIDLRVPTSVRVEAGWDRSARRSAFLNRLRISDEPLDRPVADIAAAIRSDLGISAADAHLGAVVRTTRSDRISVLTSDPGDMDAVAGDRHVVIVTI